MIHTLTLNPALDTIFYLNRLERNRTNRLRKTAVTMGGKGTHVSMNLAVMGSPSRAFGFSYGQNGRKIVDMLRESGVEPRFVHSDRAESRVNYLLVEEDNHDSTLICDRGPEPTADEVAKLIADMQSGIADGDLLVLSGDASNFPDPDIYNRLLDALKGRALRVFLDASGPSLQKTLEASPFLFKPNEHELAQLTGRAISSESDILRAIADLDRYKIEVVAVSLGGDGSLIRAGDALYRVRAPEVHVYNTVGCGDCYVAGLLHGFSRDWALEDTLRYATAASAAMAEEMLSVNFDPARARELMPRVEINRI